MKINFYNSIIVWARWGIFCKKSHIRKKNSRSKQTKYIAVWYESKSNIFRLCNVESLRCKTLISAVLISCYAYLIQEYNHWQSLSRYIRLCFDCLTAPSQIRSKLGQNKAYFFNTGDITRSMSIVTKKTHMSDIDQTKYCLYLWKRPKYIQHSVCPTFSAPSIIVASYPTLLHIQD